MPEDRSPHLDLAALAADRAELAELERLDELLRTMAPPIPSPPPDLRARTLGAVREARTPPAAAAAPAPRRRRPRWRLPVLGAAVATAAALAVALVLATRPAGTLELDTVLRAPGDPSVTATAEVRLTGIGREVEFDTDALPILPRSEFYELWFVAPGDRPGAYDRISAGTFHPDADGRSRVRLTAAVDPARYPVLSVTAEPGDGDPRPSGVEVLRSPAP